MKVGLKKIFIRLGKIFMSIIFGLFALFFIYIFFYYLESWQIRASLNSVKGVKVIQVWGNEDETLEEIEARVIINDSVEMVLGELSKDVYNYPEDVYIYEINGKSFGGYRVNIGTKSLLYNKLKITFNNPQDVVKNYDKIIMTLDSFPELQRSY